MNLYFTDNASSYRIKSFEAFFSENAHKIGFQSNDLIWFRFGLFIG